MSRLGQPGRQLRSLLFRSSIADEVDAELEFHVEMLTRELTELGMSRDRAHSEAVRRFGNIGHVSATMRRIGNQREREMHRTEYLVELKQDIIYALRQLANAPGFSLVAVLTLALGIGATTAIFSAVESVVLRQFGWAHPERTTLLMERWTGRDGSVSVGNFVDWRAMSKSFGAMGASSYSSFNVAEADAPERVLGARVTHDYFDVFGVRPELGRLPTAEEDQPGQEMVVVLGHDLWQRRFGGDMRVIGRTIRLNEAVYSVIGVMPPGFDPLLAEEQLWVPTAFTAKQRATHDEHYLNAVGLLRPNVTHQQADAEMQRVMKTLEERYPQDNKARGARVADLSAFLVGNYRERLLILLGAVGFVLLIACGNVANLLLARGEARSKEIAIRAAIGAGRGRIARQLLTESMVLAVIAATVGVALAWALVRVLLAGAPPGIPRLDQTRIDWVVLLFALGLAAMSSLIFGFAPALRASRQDLQAILKEGGRAVSSSRDRVRNGLVITQVALALTLLVGAGLLIRSALWLDRVQPGFDPRGVLMARVALPRATYVAPENVARTFRTMVENLQRSPGVRSAAASSQAPLGPGGGSNGLIPEGKALSPENALDARLRMITPGFVETMRIPLRSGRLFDDRDVRTSDLVMIVSEALAARLWPGQSPLGKRVACCEGEPGNPRWKTVVGVVGDVRTGGPTVDVYPEFYLPIEQVPPEAWEWIQRTMTLVVRGVTPNAGGLTAATRAAVHAVDPTLPMYAITTMDDALRGSVAQTRFHTMLLVTLGAIGLLLAAAGIYSVIAYVVTLRTHEIGVRLALGATARDVIRLMAWQGMRPVLAGVALGSVTALAATRLLRTSLYGVNPTDPITFVGVVVVLVGVGLAASLIPASRATKVDPTGALQA
jgi:putative ABC transport system permease protein